MVSAVDPGWSSQGVEAWPESLQYMYVVSWSRQFTLKVPLSTHVNKWAPANLMPRVSLQWTTCTCSIPPRGSNSENREIHVEPAF